MFSRKQQDFIPFILLVRVFHLTTVSFMLDVPKQFKHSYLYLLKSLPL